METEKTEIEELTAFLDEKVVKEIEDSWNEFNSEKISQDEKTNI